GRGRGGADRRAARENGGRVAVDEPSRRVREARVGVAVGLRLVGGRDRQRRRGHRQRAVDERERVVGGRERPLADGDRVRTDTAAAGRGRRKGGRAGEDGGRVAVDESRRRVG